MGLGELVLQVPGQGIRIIAEEDRANAALALCHQDRAEGALADGKAYGGIGAAGAVVGGFHAEHAVGSFVETAAGIEAGLVQGLGDRTAAGQLRPQLASPVGRCVGLGRQAGDRLEHPVEVKRTQAQLFRQGIERRRAVRRLDQLAGTGHQGHVLLIGRGLVGGGAAAGPVAGGLGLLGRVEEFDILRPGPAGATAGPAIHARGAHAIDKVAIGTGVARQHGLPAWIAFHRGCLDRSIHGALLSEDSVLAQLKGATRPENSESCG